MKPLLSLGLLVALAAGIPALGAGTDDEVLDVKRVVSRFIDVFRSDAKARAETLADLLDEGYVLVDSKGKTVEGKAAGIDVITTGLKGAWSNVRDFREEFALRSIQLFGDIAVVSGRIDISGTLREGNRPLKSEAWMTLALRRRDAKWKIVHETIVFIPGEAKGGKVEPDAPADRD